MDIQGRTLQQNISNELISQVEDLRSRGVIPKLAIVAFQDSEAAWGSYVKAKVKFAEKIGVIVEVIMIESNNAIEFDHILDRLNEDSTYHGIIIQRPFPEDFVKENIIEAVVLSKDVDGFRTDSPYAPPLWEAVKYILEYVAQQENTKIEQYLDGKSVVVLGKGETGGKPVADGLKKMNINPIVIDSKTPNPSQITQEADIIVCTVGRHVLSPENIKMGVVLIGVGMHREEDGKLHGDYETTEIENIASYYTRVPGGVGPVNVAFLFSNLLQAANSA